MLQWIFFDVGNVILNDDPAQARAFVLLHQALLERGNEMSLDALLAERRNLVREEGMEPTRPYFQALGKRLLRDAYPGVLAEMAADIFPRWGDLNPLIPGIRDVILKLGQNYRLGLIANQPLEVIDVLRAHGLWDSFTVHGISAEVGFHKPDRGFFGWALDQAECRPEEALMIGDRIDNDILPARTTGMKTLQLVLHPSAKGYEPEGKGEQAYMRERIFCFEQLRGQNNSEQADLTEYSVEKIPLAVATLDGK